MTYALTTLGVMFDLNFECKLYQIQITKQDALTYCMNIENDSKPWYFGIKQYMKCRQYHIELQRMTNAQ